MRIETTTIPQLIADLRADLRAETDPVAAYGLRMAIRGIEDFEADGDTCPDGLPIVKRDPDIFCDEGSDTRMVRDDEQNIRYSPDQPRRPDGTFGSGDDTKHPRDPDKHATFTKADEKNFKEIMAAWVVGGKPLGQMRKEATADINAGRGHENLLVAGIREEKVNSTVYRGMHGVNDEMIANLKAGGTIDLMPASFSENKEIADMYAHVAVPGASGGDKIGRGHNGIMYTAQVSNGIRCADYLPHGAGNKLKEDFAVEREVITAGRFKVGSVRVARETIDGDHFTIYHVKLKQTDVF